MEFTLKILNFLQPVRRDEIFLFLKQWLVCSFMHKCFFLKIARSNIKSSKCQSHLRLANIRHYSSSVSSWTCVYRHAGSARSKYPRMFFFAGHSPQTQDLKLCEFQADMNLRSKVSFLMFSAYYDYIQQVTKSNIPLNHPAYTYKWHE